MLYEKKAPDLLRVRKLVAAISIILLPIEVHAHPSHGHKSYYIQIGSYQNQKTAQVELKRALQKVNLKGIVHAAQINNHTYYQVRLGPFHDMQHAKAFKAQLHRLGQASFIQTSFAYDHYSEVSQPIAAPIVHHPKTTTKYHPVQPITPPPESSAAPDIVFGDSTYRFFQKIYPVRALTQGTLAEQSNFFDGDLMIPFIGNNDWIGYVDGEGNYANDKAWVGSMGLGLRGVRNNNLWGGYVFADKNFSVNDQTFWVINPGIEMMGLQWDAHINGYIPLRETHSFGIYSGESLDLDTVTFANHTQFDHLFNVQEITGPGVDGEIGYTLRNLYNLRPFVGGYYFNLKNGPKINGVEGGLELPINENITFLLHDAYDDVQKNNAMATLRVTFGGIPSRPINNVRDRMLDPLQRHLGATQTGNGIPIIKINQDLGNTVVRDNIWFFNTTSPTLFSGFASCTFENPCGTLNNLAISGINTISPNASFFIASGNYLPEAGGFNLFNGQSFYGRQFNFFKPALGFNRPIINNTLFLNGNNNINNLQVIGNAISPVTNDSPGPSPRPIMVGIEVANTAVGSVNINNTDVTVSGGTGSDKAGVRLLSNFSPLGINGSTIVSGITTAPSFYSYGVLNGSSSFLAIHKSLISAYSLDGSGDVSLGGAFGIQNQSNGTVSVLQSIVNAASINSTDAEGIQNLASGGILLVDQSAINALAVATTSASTITSGIFNRGGPVLVSNSMINVRTEGAGVSGFVYGINNAAIQPQVLFTVTNTLINVSGDNNQNSMQLTGVQNSGSTSYLLMNNSNINVNSANSNASLYAIINLNNSTTAMNNSFINAVTTGTGLATGLDNNNGTSYLSNSAINATTTTGAANAVTNAGGTVNSTQTTCTENGVVVPCS